MLRAALCCAVLIVVVCEVRAGGPVAFRLAGREQVDKGNADGVALAEGGALGIGPQLTLAADTGQPYVWSSAAEADGTVYLGTGHEGRVYIVPPGGPTRQLFDADELDVTALAVDGRGNLFVATSPEGRIYRVARDGTWKIWFDPPDKYIWSLLVAGSTLYAGTGENGIVYRISDAGAGTAWADTDETHIVSLAAGPTGDVLAGTDPGGLVLRIGADGKPFALLDSPLQEIHAIRTGPNATVWALAIASSAATTASDQGSVSIVESSTTTAARLDLLSIGVAEARSRRDVGDSRAALYRIAPDGAVDVAWNSRGPVGYGLLVDSTRVLIGTGDRGRVVALDPVSLETTVLAQPNEDQTWTLLAAGGSVYATTNNLGKLFQIGPGAAARGVYQSPVHDAKAVAEWGRLVAHTRGGVTVETRSGNSENPDSTWSAWRPVMLVAGTGAIASPAARYLQWRVTLQGADARVEPISVVYMPRNAAPEVTMVFVFPPGIALQEIPQQPLDPGLVSSGYDPQVFGLSTNIPPRRVFQRGARSLLWQAKDPDDDKLAYTVQYRTSTDSQWHTLASGLAGAWCTIDSDALPDGQYVFRIVASDAPNNPVPRALQGERTSEPVDIDNTAPTLAPVVGVDDVTFTVVDTTSRIASASYSIDGGPWIAVLPVDGIADHLQESYRVRLEGLGAGEHVLAFRVVDVSFNVGLAKVGLSRK
jgi:hypothetical protein